MDFTNVVTQVLSTVYSLVNVNFESILTVYASSLSARIRGGGVGMK